MIDLFIDDMIEHIINNTKNLEELKEKIYELRQKLLKCYNLGLSNDSVFSLQKTIEELENYLKIKTEETKIKEKEKNV